MKKLILSVITAIGLVAVASAQTATNLVVDPPDKPAQTPASTTIWDFVTATSTNWYVAPFAIYDVDTGDFGGGLGLAYQLDVPVVQDVFMPILRFDYLSGATYLVEGTLQIQAPRSLMGKFPVRPFGVVGIATPFSGGGEENGSAIAIYGAGASVRISKRFGVIGDFEWWDRNNAPTSKGVRFGVWYNFP